MNIFLLRRIIAVAILAITANLTSLATDRLMVVGEATWGGWSLDRTSVMMRDAANPDIFRYTGWLEADKEFKFLAQAQWDGDEYRNASSDPYEIAKLIHCNNSSNPGDGNRDNKFKVSQSANYTITCNLSELTISVEKADYQAAPIHHNALYLVGSATPGGWALYESLQLNQDDTDPFLFSARVYLTPGTFKIATNCWADYGEQKF